MGSALHRLGGLRVDDAIEEALLGVVGSGAVAAATAAARQAAERRDQVREALGRDLEAARHAADRAFHQYDAADPANRLVAGELERRWNRALARVAEVESRIAAHDAAGSGAGHRPGHAWPGWHRTSGLVVGAKHRHAAEEAHRAYADP